MKCESIPLRPAYNWRSFGRYIPKSYKIKAEWYTNMRMNTDKSEEFRKIRLTSENRINRKA